MSDLNGNRDAYIIEVGERSVANKTRLDNLEPRVDRLERIVLKVILAAASGGGIAGLIAKYLV
jgi:hypothetical protein